MNQRKMVNNSHHLGALEQRVELVLHLMLDEGYIAKIYTTANDEIVRLEAPRRLSESKYNHDAPLSKYVSARSLNSQELLWMLQRGLVQRSGNTLLPLPEAKSYIRRRNSLPLGGTEFLSQHHELQLAKKLVPSELPLSAKDAQLLTDTTLYNREESPLAWLSKRKEKNGAPYLERYHFEAGERLRADFTYGQIMPSTTTNWSLSALMGCNGNTNRNASQNLTDGAMAARQRFNLAMIAVGDEFSGVLVDVCCFIKGLETIEHERQWPARSAKIILKLALNCLAKHYGLIAQSNRFRLE